MVLLLFFQLAHFGEVPSEAQGLAFHGQDSIRLADLGELPDFSLVECSGRTMGRSDLLGRVWIADFIFTRCAGPCPELSKEMARLQKDLPREARLVSFSVDPEWDTPAVLTEYAKRYGADPARWKFLTGPKDVMVRLIKESFRLSVEETGGAVGEAILHDIRIVLVDTAGHVRGYYDSKDSESLGNLREDVYKLLGQRPPLLPLTSIPRLNAALNASSAVLLIAGFLLIRRKKVVGHKICMLLALGVSILFLVSYLYYHFHHGTTRFQGTGWIRPAYFSILISHTVLAASVPVLALITIYRAVQSQWERHKRIARWTLPIWLYVSVTGVVIYFLLYRAF